MHDAHHDDSSPYAQPPAEVPRLEECGFYHTIELPGLGVQRGQWDLRQGIGAYVGPTDFRGLRVLEIGTANGFVCFELERRGASVVAVDLPESFTYDARPGASRAAGGGGGLRMIRNAFWLGHALLSSSAEVVYAHVDALPDAIGHFDVVVLANVLQHLRDPLRALETAARYGDSVVVTEADWMAGLYEDVPGLVLLIGAAPYSWFQVRLPLLTTFLTELGLGEQIVTRHEQLLLDTVDYSGDLPRRVEHGDKAVPHFTVTARRPKTG
jgi:SAM-dependent methyltransferase